MHASLRTALKQPPAAPYQSALAAPPACAHCSLGLYPQPDENGQDDLAQEALQEGLPLAVAALQRLLQVTGLALGAGARHHGGRFVWPRLEPVQLPPLAGLSALTRLELWQLTRPPPDWTCLAGLRRLSLRINLIWATPSLTALISLTHLEMDYTHSFLFPAPSHLARLPSLASVRAVGGTPAWCGQLAALRPDVTCYIA